MNNSPFNAVDTDGGAPDDIIRRVNGVEVERIETPDDFDIVIDEWILPEGSPLPSFVSVGIYDKRVYSSFQLDPPKFQSFPASPGTIDFDPGGQLILSEIAGLAFKGVGLGIAGLRGLTQAATTETGSYLVYEGIGQGGVRYIGITSRDIAIRAAEHMADPLKTGLRFVPIRGLENLSKQAARVAEQRLINYYGLQKNGGVLFNKINSIAPSKWAQFGVN